MVLLFVRPPFDHSPHDRPLNAAEYFLPLPNYCEFNPSGFLHKEAAEAESFSETYKQKDYEYKQPMLNKTIELTIVNALLQMLQVSIPM